MVLLYGSRFALEEVVNTTEYNKVAVKWMRRYFHKINHSGAGSSQCTFRSVYTYNVIYIFAHDYMYFRVSYFFISIIQYVLSNEMNLFERNGHIIDVLTCSARVISDFSMAMY